MREKVHHVYLIVVFIVSLLLPLICFEYKDDAVSFVQAKTLAAKPSAFTEGKWNVNFWSEIQQYVEERIGFKDESISAVLVLKYYFFHVLDVPDFSLGSNENIYYSNYFDQIDGYDGKNKYTMDELSEMANSMAGMQQALSKTDTDLYCIYIPNKEGVYWEDYNADIAVRAESSRMDDFCEYLKNNTEIKTINLKEELVKHKNEEMLYYRVYDGSHWNQNGAFRGTRAVFQRIGEDYPEIKGISSDDYIKKETDFSGCMERYKDVPFVHENFHFKDTIIYYEPVNGWSSSVYINDVIGKGETHFHNDHAANDQSVLILGDSYMASFCLNYYAEQFRDVYFMSYASDPADILELCEKAQCDVTLFEVVERCFSKELYIYTIARYEQY